MRVLAASFPDGTSARAAKTQLLAAFGLDDSQIDIEALAHHRGVDGVAILAGQFHDDVVEEARDVVEDCHGKLVIDIDGAGTNA